jgi:hypothetical protein
VRTAEDAVGRVLEDARTVWVMMGLTAAGEKSTLWSNQLPVGKIVVWFLLLVVVSFGA